MSVRDIDFSTLVLKDALDLAILIEEEAEERYRWFAHELIRRNTAEAATFFQAMARYEQSHGRELHERRRHLFPGEPRAVHREMIDDVEAPAEREAWPAMSLGEALAAALRAEVKAHEFFTAALAFVRADAVRALFEELASEEQHHAQLVREQMAKLPAEPTLLA